MTAYDYDLLIIGGGPGGVAAAKLGALRGLHVGLVADDNLLGYGLSGAYKSKAMYEMAREYITFHRRWNIDPLASGVSFADISNTNMAQAEELRQVYVRQFEEIGIPIIQGYGRFVDPHTVEVGGKAVTGGHVVIATGTRPRLLPNMEMDGRHVLTSDEIVLLDRPIQSLLVLGAGVIGCEFAAIFAAFGVDVTLVDTRERILPLEDADIAALLTRSFTDLKVTVRGNARCKGVEIVGDRVRTDLGDGAPVETDAVLLAIGRVPNTRGLNVEAAGVALNDWSYIPVNDNLQTNVPHIYAVGDVGQRASTLDLALVHVAEAEGRHAATHILQRADKHLSTRHVPFIIFSLPMVAGAGLSEMDARAKLGEVRVGKFANCRNHRAHAQRARTGFVKLIVGPEGDDRVYGARGVGDGVDSIVGEVSMMIEHELPYTYLLDSIHAHPSLSESLQGAARIIAGHATPYLEGEETVYEIGDI